MKTTLDALEEIYGSPKLRDAVHYCKHGWKKPVSDCEMVLVCMAHEKRKLCDFDYCPSYEPVERESIVDDFRSEAEVEI